MADLDLVGEMSLEQLENNIEELYGKDKANELAYFLRHNSIDSSMQNKLYAAIFNNIKSQNSVDDILKNPSKLSHIINSIEKQITEYQIKQSNDIRITSSSNANLLDNKEFLESPTNYLKSLPLENQLPIIKNILFDNEMSEDIADYTSKVFSNAINGDKNSQDAVMNGFNANGFSIEEKRMPDFIDNFFRLKTFIKQNPNLKKDEILPSFIKTYEQQNLQFTEQELQELALLSQLDSKQFEKIYEDCCIASYTISTSVNFNKNSNLINLTFYEISANNQTEYLNKLSQQDREAILSELAKQEQRNTFENTSNFEMHQNLDLDSIENIFDAQFYEAKDPAENENVFEYSSLENIFDEVADTNAIQFDFVDQEPTPETPPIATSPAEFIQQEMQKQAEEAEKIGDEISEQSDLAQEADKENNYMLEVEEKKGFFSSIKDRFSKFMQRITQKSLPDPNATRAQTTNQSFESFERKSSILSTIRSIGDRVTSAVKGISSLNKQNQTPEIKNTATIVGAQKTNSQAMEMDNNPTDTNKKSEIIRPKAVQARPKTNEMSSFDQFIKVSNEGNKIEAAARKGSKASQEISDKTQDSQKISEDTSRDDD